MSTRASLKNSFEHRRLLRGFELLERRNLLAVDVHITNAYLVDGNSNFIAAPPVGEAVFARVDWSTSNAPDGVNYVVRYTMDGIPLDSGTIAGASGTNLSWLWFRGGWLASPGSHSIQITVDPDNNLGDTTPGDNTTTITFSPVAPSTLPHKLIWPLAGTQGHEWNIGNYVDADPRPGQQADFNGGNFVYDGHDAMDIGSSNFSSMDRGLQVMAAAGGTVIQAQDGNFDRNTAATNPPANFVVIDHGNGWVAYYYHLAANTITVKAGDSVVAGQVLGIMGSSGNSTGPHLHFALYHNNHVVETNYDPSAYFEQVTPYEGNAPHTVLASGVSSFNPSGALNVEEMPVSTTSIPTTYSGTMWAWVNPGLFTIFDSLTLNWLFPGGGVASSYNFASPSTFAGGYYYFGYNGAWSSSPGNWTVQLLYNSVEIARNTFLVTSGTTAPTARVTDGGTYLPNNRTTPVEFGTTSVGSPVQKTFAIGNVGHSTLTLGTPVLPPGFSIVGAAPTSVAVNGSANLTVQFDATLPDTMFGQIQIPTNDPTAPIYGFNIRGVATGSPPSGSPFVSNLGPAARFVMFSAPVAINGVSTALSDNDSGDFGGGSLTLAFASGGVASDQLGVINQGAGAGQIGVSGSDVTYGGVTIGSMSGGTTAAPLTIALNESATIPAVQALLRNLSFVNTTSTATAAARYLRLTLVDDLGKVSNQPIRVVVVDTNPVVVDLDGAPNSVLGYTTSWGNTGGVNISDSDAIVTNDTSDLVSMTASLTAVANGDVLSANTSGTPIAASYDATNGVLTLSGAATPAQYQTVLRTVKYNNTVGGPGTGTRLVSFAASDGTMTSPTAQAVIVVTSPIVDLNGAPAGTDHTVTFTYSGAITLVDSSNALVTDTGNIASLTVTIPVAQPGDSLTATASGGVAVSYNAAGQVLNLTGTASAAVYQTVLRTVKYTNVSGGPTVPSFTVNFVANDGVSSGNTAVSTVIVQIPPKVDLNGNQIAGGNNLTSTWSNAGAVNLADPFVGVVFNGQTPNLVSMTATLVSPVSGDSLAGTAAGGIVVSYDSANGVLKMTGNATAANYQTVLRSIKYNNTGPVNLVSKTVNVVGFDATSSSATAVATVTIQPLRLDLNGDLTLGTGYNTFWSNAGAVNITGSSGITATTLVDGKAANLTSATATIVGVHTGDVLSATAAGGITVSYDAGNHVLNMTGSDTLTNYQSVLRSVKYNNTSGGPGVGLITVNFSAVDTNAAVSNATSTTQIVLAGSQVVGRYTFYNQSGTSPTIRYDGTTAGISTLDDGAIAFDKVAYIPSATAVPSTFANVISYSRGINGIMIDLAGSHGTIESTDFIFRVGNNNTPGSAGSSWATAPNPASISVRAGAGVGGSDRIEIIWNNGDITKKWLQVVMKTDAGTGTGLAALGGTYAANYGDVFYFGHALANSGQGDSATLASTDGTDELEARNHSQTVLQNFSQINPRDYNRDGAVDSADALLARNNQTTGLAGANPATRYINLAAGSPPNAPEGDGGDGGGSVPAAITMGADSDAAGSSVGSSSSASSWLSEALTASSAPSNGATTAALLQLLGEDESSAAADGYDEPLASLLADLAMG